MRNKKFLFISVLLFMIVLSIGAVSADDGDSALASNSTIIVSEDSNSVSGGVNLVTENPWNTTGELSYDIPSDAKTIKSADVYVNVYSGRADNTYGANANITITADNSTTTHFEPLWIEEGSTDGTVYTVNDHTTKCYSDFMIHYDITDMVDGLSGTNLKINVDTFEMEGKQFDGRIKLIALILAYDDGDDDSISYWINDDQLWTKSNVTVTFDTEGIANYTEARLANVVLSSGDGAYWLNGDILDDADDHVSGDYYQYNEWDVTGVVKANQANSLCVVNLGTGAYGSIKNVLSVLTVLQPAATEITITPEYTSVPSAYAGTNNTLTVKVKSSNGVYTAKLFVDGVEVDEAEFDVVDGEGTLLLTDPTIRDVDASTANGAENNMVNYTVEVYSNGDVLGNNAISLPVLYNGNLGSGYEYNITGIGDASIYDITGDLVVDIKDVGSYLGSTAMTRTDVWSIELDNRSVITNGFIYVPYNWFNAKTYTEDISMFNATFNGHAVTPVAWYRDQGNLGNYGKYGYGVLVYDVSDWIGIGNNSFVLNKVNPTPAVYPSALVYMYNTTGSPFSRTVTILNGADLLANSNNVAGRVVSADTMIAADVDDIFDARLYVLAASAQAGESDIIFNGEVYSNVWSGTSSTTDLFVTDVTGLVDEFNSISFVATGSTILALPQILVTSEYSGPATEISLVTEYTSVPSAYAGTNNTITVKVKTSEAGNYAVFLYADGTLVDSADVALVEGDNTILLTDPTIRDVDASTVNGAENNYVNYVVLLSYDDFIINDKGIDLPVLYNGNLGSGYEYNITGIGDASTYDITGDLVVDVKDVGSYLGSTAMTRTDVWSIDLDNRSVITNGFIYVPYNWFNAKTYTEDIYMFNVTFNGHAVTPVAWYRDQGNLGSYGRYGYGVLVYDVSDWIGIGNNSFVLNKVNPTPAVYPSALVYMYNTTGSTIPRTVTILNGADLLANSYNVAGRVVSADTMIAADVNNIADARLYVLAASAQAGESDIIFNGEVYSNVWSGTSSTTDLFVTDVTGLVDEFNSISFVATGSTILALPQILVTAKFNPIDTIVTANDVTALQNVSGNLVATLTDVNGYPITGAKLKIVIPNKLTKYIRTDANGQVSVDVSKFDVGTYTATITFVATELYNKATTKANIYVVDKMDTILTAPDITAEYKDGSNLVATLTDVNGNAVSDVKLKLVVNKVTKYIRTDANGQVALSLANLEVGNYTATITFIGDDLYNRATTTSKISILPKKVGTVLTAPDVTAGYKDGSKLVVTIKDENGNAISGVKIKIVINKVSKYITTDANGQVAMSLANLDVGDYNATITFIGDDVYKKSTTTAKISILNKTNTVLTAPDVTAVYKDGSKLIGTLTDVYGNAISDAKVKIVLNKVTKYIRTDANGQVAMSLNNLDVGTYKATLTFVATELYNKSTTTSNVTITSD